MKLSFHLFLSLTSWPVLVGAFSPVFTVPHHVVLRPTTSLLAEAKNSSEIAHDNVEDFRDQLSISRSNSENGERIDVVMKFGGSSLANEERIDHVAKLIKNQRQLGYRPRAVVCSAMGKTTNSLLSAGDFALGT